MTENNYNKIANELSKLCTTLFTSVDNAEWYNLTKKKLKTDDVFYFLDIVEDSGVQSIVELPRNEILVKIDENGYKQFVWNNMTFENWQVLWMRKAFRTLSPITTLTQLARHGERLNRTTNIEVKSGLTKLFQLHLFTKGYRGSDLIEPVYRFIDEFESFKETTD